MSTFANQGYGETAIVTETFSFKWRINKYSLIPKGRYFSSPCFTAKNISFKLTLECSSSNNYTYFYISGIPTYCHKINSKVVLRNSTGLKIHESSLVFNCNNKPDNQLKLIEPVNLESQKSDLTDDILDVTCELEMTLEKILVYKRLDAILKSKATKSNHSNFLDFFNSQDFSDVKLIVGGKEIFAHKVVLSNLSPVFKAMFTNDMKESNENCVKINDIKYEIFIELLRFIYSGQVENLESIANDLLVAADRYDIKDLKELCVSSLYDELTIDNAAEIYEIARDYSLEKLRKEAFQLIASKFHEVSESDMAKLSSTHQDILVNAFHLSKEA